MVQPEEHEVSVRVSIDGYANGAPLVEQVSCLLVQ